MISQDSQEHIGIYYVYRKIKTEFLRLYHKIKKYI